MHTTPRVAAIHDLSGFGRCSMTVVSPVLSAMGVQCCPILTAYLSTHTGGFEGYVSVDLTEQMEGTIAHWRRLGLTFDGVYTGFMASPRQIELSALAMDTLKWQGGVAVADPVMGDHGRRYATYTDELCAAMGGLCAEKLVFGDVTTGSTGDIKQATNTARAMVTEYGMSDLGPIFLSGDHEIFLGKNFQQTSAGLSEEMNRQVDQQVHKLLDEGEQRATSILTENRAKLDAIVGVLMEKEHINREEFEAFMEDRPYDPERAEALRFHPDAPKPQAPASEKA